MLTKDISQASVQANQMTALREFLRSWDTSPKSSSQADSQAAHGCHGEINPTGKITSPAVILTRHHPRFAEVLETEIRDLVLCLISTLDCITYSSCSGHTSADGDRISCGGHVGIVPRTPDEYRKLHFRLSAAIEKVGLPETCISIELDESVLESDDLVIPCLDINFHPLENSAEPYFRELKSATKRLISELDSLGRSQSLRLLER